MIYYYKYFQKSDYFISTSFAAFFCKFHIFNFFFFYFQNKHSKTSFFFRSFPNQRTAHTILSRLILGCFQCLRLRGIVICFFFWSFKFFWVSVWSVDKTNQFLVLLAIIVIQHDSNRKNMTSKKKNAKQKASPAVGLSPRIASNMKQFVYPTHKRKWWALRLLMGRIV